ncbi:MAG: hypothetical protein J0H01_28525 [Rhizobiales bacterium]|nr:hypothetical protein [Hyphomicrobiales bacterium]
MNLLSLIVREFVGMFIDDEFLAIAVLMVVAVAAALAFWLAALPLVVGGVLLAGSVAVLMSSALKASGKS